MKIFGNNKRPSRNDFTMTIEEPTAQDEVLVYEDEPEVEYEPEVREKAPKWRSVLLFVAALGLFLCSIAMTMTLITKSADIEPLPRVTSIKPMEYVVNMEQPNDAVIPVEYTAPISKNGSQRINFLIVAVDDNESNMMVLASVNMNSKRVSLMSFPRETYVTGSYDEPRLRNVYTASQKTGRGVQALMEKAREMVGFWPDYYLVLDSNSVNCIFDLIGDIPFDIPASPRYSDAKAGQQHVDGHSAMQLFSCRNNYNRVETDSSDVQRSLLIQMFCKLFAQKDAVKENAEQLSQVMDTDLNVSQLAYMGFFLQDVPAESVASMVCPGELVTVEEDGKDYYQVNSEETARLLNFYFNPLPSELTVYDLNFRQLAGDSGEGEYEEYGFHGDGGNNQDPMTTDPDSSEDTVDPTESTDPIETIAPPPETLPTSPPDPLDPNG